MDLRQLRFFVTLADTLNFHRAAERLNMSQPPLTVAIRKLEDEFGVKLFDRYSRGVGMTAAGLAALGPAREALAHASLVREAALLGFAGEIGGLKIGFVGSATSEVLPRIIPAFRAAYPKVTVDLVEMTSASIVDAVAAGQIDVGLVRMPVVCPPELEIHAIEKDQLVVACKEDHPVAKRVDVALEALADTPFIIHSPVSILHAVTLLACQKAGFAPQVAQAAIQVQTILSLVRSGLGVALVPAKMVRFTPDGVVLRPLVEPVEIATGIACHRNASRLVRHFVDLTRASCDI